MFSLLNSLLSSVILLIYSFKTCTGDIPSPALTLFMPGEPEWTDVLVRRVNDNLTLVCELRGDTTKRRYVWNFVAENSTNDRPFKVEPSGPTTSSTLFKDQLQESDSGHYMCSAPPFSVTKYILVQSRGPTQCGRGTFWCGLRCMAAQYVCDGRVDCLHGEDEAAPMCSQHICARADKLNCSSGRCISSSACCRRPSPLCQQPSCCEEYPLYSRLEANYVEEYPPLFEDRHAPDDYGFIQSTIYTVTDEICKKHWMRDGYMRYKLKNKLTTGSEAPKSNLTKWKLYRLLSFLDNVQQERSISSVDNKTVSSQNQDAETDGSTHNNIQQGTDATLSEANTELGNTSMNNYITERNPDVFIAIGPQISIKKPARSSRDDKRERERENGLLSLMKYISGTNDEFKSFANHIEHVLKNLPTRLLQIKAKQEIFAILTKYEILAADNGTTSNSSTPSTSTVGTAMTSVSEESQHTILNASPVSSYSEPNDLT